MRSVWLVLSITAVATCVACSDDRADARRLSSVAFDRAVAELCDEHGRALDDWGDEFADGAFDESLSDEELESRAETARRRLIALKRQLIAEMRRIEPADAADAWRDAIDRFEAAIDRAASGPRVDVRADGLDAATNKLIDDFGLEGCF